VKIKEMSFTFSFHPFAEAIWMGSYDLLRDHAGKEAEEAARAKGEENRQ
jgi:hypothetical protein